MARITINDPGQTNQTKESAEAAYVNLEQLIQQIEAIQVRQSDALARLNQWAAGALTHSQAIMKLTGVKLEQLVGSDATITGIGDSSSPQKKAVTLHSVDSLYQNLTDIEYSLIRLNQYKAAFQCLPLHTPVDHYRLSSGFGMRKDPFNHKQSMHNGIDMAALPGTKVHAPAIGPVVRVFNNSGYGKFIEIKHPCGLVTRYGHLQKALVKAGQKITFNQPIATIGNSGRSTGPHLHYEILLHQQPQDPINFFKAGKYVFKNTKIH
jgi:murein DD-endopeptidase MepM/ murein hydrolase activator NlpD